MKEDADVRIIFKTNGNLGYDKALIDYEISNYKEMFELRRFGMTYYPSQIILYFNIDLVCHDFDSQYSETLFRMKAIMNNINKFVKKELLTDVSVEIIPKDVKTKTIKNTNEFVTDTYEFMEKMRHFKAFIKDNKIERFDNEKIDKLYKDIGEVNNEINEIVKTIEKED